MLNFNQLSSMQELSNTKDGLGHLFLKEDVRLNRFKFNFIIALLFSILSIIFIIPAKLLGNLNTKFWLCLAADIIVYFIYPLLQLIRRKGFPWLIGIVICLQFLFGLTIANAFNMYENVKHWDLILHGLFGAELLLIGYFILINNGGDNMNVLGRFIFLFMFVIGVAMVWEISEYIAYLITNKDFSHMFDYKPGENPLYDTMTDIIVALVGANIVYYIFVIDYMTGRKTINKLKKILKIEDGKNED